MSEDSVTMDKQAVVQNLAKKIKMEYMSNYREVWHKTTDGQVFPTMRWAVKHQSRLDGVEVGHEL